MNLLKTIAIFAVLYVGATILLRVVFDKLYRNIQKRYLTKEKRRLEEGTAPKDKTKIYTALDKRSATNNCSWSCRRTMTKFIIRLFNLDEF